MGPQTGNSPEVRVWAVRMVFEHRGEHASKWPAEGALSLGCETMLDFDAADETPMRQSSTSTSKTQKLSSMILFSRLGRGAVLLGEPGSGSNDGRG